MVARSPERSVSAGATVTAPVALVAGDRQSDGVFPGWSIAHNIGVRSLKKLRVGPLLSLRLEDQLANGWRERIKIRTPDVHNNILSLSGGNQQKALFARALGSDARVLLMDDPMRGVDVGTKAEIYALFDDLAHAGIPILMISSDLPEVLALADRILVMRHGRITGELTRAEATEEKIMHLAALGSDNVPVEE